MDQKISISNNSRLVVFLPIEGKYRIWNKKIVKSTQLILDLLLNIIKYIVLFRAKISCNLGNKHTEQFAMIWLDEHRTVGQDYVVFSNVVRSIKGINQLVIEV